MMEMTSSDLFDNDDHSRTIIHIDLDCFYAQVEMIKNPELRNVPLGIQQKNYVITSNYVAREFGIKKCMLITDALKVCPELVLVKGEDLYDYRKMSEKVSNCLQKFSTAIEKLGLDENFIDVTTVVKDRLLLMSSVNLIQPVGSVYNSFDETCECGCVQRLNIGSMIASEMRECLRDELGVTCCAGIAHNKLIAKLGGAVNKPNQQTVVYPSSASQLLFSLSDIRSIPGIGRVLSDNLKELNIRTVEDLRNYPLEKLQKTFGIEKAKTMMDLSYGIDNSPVKPTGKPQSIGLEDSCRTISLETEVREKFQQLLNRIMILLREDGRLPRTIKVTVRKFDVNRKTSHREQKQCNISPSLFTHKNIIQLTQSSEDKVLIVIMRLFHKLIDIKKPFHVTLLGLTFTKFQDRQTGKHSIASFLMNNISVQSVTSLQNSKDLSSSVTPMDCSSGCNTDGSESEIEPSPKKGKYGSFIAKRRCLASEMDCPSPSKLRVAELRLNSREMDRSPIENCPDNIDPDVFNELPHDIQQELLQQWKTEKKSTSESSTTSKPKPNNTLLKYLIKNK